MRRATPINPELHNRLSWVIFDPMNVLHYDQAFTHLKRWVKVYVLGCINTSSIHLIFGCIFIIFFNKKS